MEQTQTQVCLGVLGDKRPSLRLAASRVSEGKVRLAAWNKTGRNGALSGVKIGRKLSAQLFQGDWFMSKKSTQNMPLTEYSMEDIFPHDVGR